MGTSVSDEMVKEFLHRLGLASLEEVEKAFSENLMKVELMREMSRILRELEGVDNIPSLLEKVYKERDNVSFERQGWQKMKEELEELKGAMSVRDEERLIDKWKAINDECQALTTQLDAIRVKQVSTTSRGASESGQTCPQQKERLPTMSAEISRGERLLQGASGERVGDYHTRVYGGAGDRSDQSACYSNYQSQYNVGAGFPNEMTGMSGGNGCGLRNDNTVMGKSLGWLANSLPEMTKYSGMKEDWDDFETGFMIRYGGMETPVAMSLLKDNLVGEARDALRGVPEEEKVKGVASVMSWLRSRLSNETPFQDIELTKMLHHQTVDGKTVGKICEELEEWTAMLNDGDVISVESSRRRQLLILYEGKYTEHMRLLTLFSEGASYSMMKAALVELEYLRKTEMRSQGYNNGINDEVTCSCCGGYGHDEFHGPSNGEGGYSGAHSGPSGGVEIISRNSDQ